MEKNFFISVVFSLSILFLSLISLLFFRTEWINEQYQAQQKLVIRFFNEQMNEQLAQKTEIDYQRYFIQSSHKKKVQHFFIPSLEETRASRGLETLASGYFSWMYEKTEMLYALLRMCLYKMNVLGFLSPWLLVFYVTLVIEGEIYRRRKAYSFAIASALRFGFALKAKVIVMLIFVYLFIFPFYWSLTLLCLLVLLFCLLGFILSANSQYR